MPPKARDWTERQVLLEAIDRDNAEVIISIGLARNDSQALRAGLAFLAHFVRTGSLAQPTS